MVIDLNIRSGIVRLALFVAALLLTGFLLKTIVTDFIVYAICSDPLANRALLESTVAYFPHSPRLLSRLALAETGGASPDLDSAERHANEAIELSPNNYDYRLLLATIKINRGDPDAAEQALNEALRLAPYNHVVHWRLANLLIREGKTDAAIEHFRFSANYNPVSVPVALDLVWQISGQNVSYLREIVRESPPGQLKLALFLVNKSRVTEAVDIFGKIDKEVINSAPEISPFIDSLIAKGSPKLANDLWKQIKYSDSKGNERSAIWNGGFEIEPLMGLKQFEWQIDKNDFARIAIVASSGHSGQHSLLIDFIGRDTTRIDNQIKQLIVLRPGAACQLNFFVKSEKYFSPNQGVTVAILANDGKPVAESKPVATGDSDWQQMSVSFTAPRTEVDGVPLTVSIRRLPKYDFDEPTRGRLWFDDFSVSEVIGK